MRYIMLMILGLLNFANQAHAGAMILGQETALGGSGGKIVSIRAGGPYEYWSDTPQINMIDGLAGISNNYVGLKSQRPANNVPVSYRLNFAAAYTINDFVLWNDRDVTGRGGTVNNGDGVQAFKLDLFSNTNSLLGSLTATALDSVSQQVFTMGSPIAAVSYVLWTINSFYDDGPAHVGCGECQHQWREVGFNFVPLASDTGVDIVVTVPPTSSVDEPASLLLVAFGLAGLLVRRRRLQNA